MKVKDQFLGLSLFNLNNGTQIRFREDRCLGNAPLKDQYPLLYYIVQKQHVSVS
uniref:Uncharacterized protein n=1 Tax=Arundo donax TaxID=35708 RepID=A0A0A8YXW0_ARUDO